MPCRDPEKRKEYNRLYRLRPEEKAKRAKRSKKERSEDSQRIRKNIKAYKLRLKREVFTAYGNKCSCLKCDVENPKFLTIDHVNNDGAEHRKKVKSGTQILLWARRNNFPPTLRLMCWNCNCARQWNDGICLHLQ